MCLALGIPVHQAGLEPQYLGFKMAFAGLGAQGGSRTGSRLSGENPPPPVPAGSLVTVEGGDF